VGELAELTKDAFVVLQEVEMAQLTLWLLGFWQLADVVLVQPQVLEIFVDEAFSEVFFISALAIGLTVRHNLPLLETSLH